MTSFAQHKHTTALLGIFLLGLLLRLVLAAIIPPAGDIDAWGHYSTYWQQGLYSPYNEVDRYKYSPFWFWVITLVSFVCQKTGYSFSFGIRLPIIFSDIALFWLIFDSCQRLRFNVNQTLLALSAFFLNPVSLQISGFYGQFGNMSLLFVLCAWYAWSFRSRARFWWTLASLNISIAIKHFTIMLIPAFAFAQKNWKSKIWLSIGSPILFFAILAPFWIQEPHWTNINVFHYHLGSGYWGWLGVICRSVLLFTGFNIIEHPWFQYFSLFNVFLYIGLIIASFWAVRRYPLLDSLILILLLFYSLTTQMAPQYTIWIVPFAAFRPNRYFLAYSIIGGIQLAFFYYSHYHWFFNYPLLPIYSEAFVILRYLTWITCVLWLIHALKSKETLPSL